MRSRGNTRHCLKLWKRKRGREDCPAKGVCDMDIADWVIVAILVFSAWDGYRTGLVAQLVRFLGTVLAYVSAWQFHGLLTPTLDHWLRATVLKHMHSSSLMPALSLFNTGNTVGTLAQAIASALSFGIVFYVSLIIIRYAGHLLGAVFSLPVLSFVNRVAGLATGVVIAFLLIAVLLSVASYLPMSPVKTQISHSALAPMFRQPIRALIKIEGGL